MFCVKLRKCCISIAYNIQLLAQKAENETKLIIYDVVIKRVLMEKETPIVKFIVGTVGDYLL